MLEKRIRKKLTGIVGQANLEDGEETIGYAVDGLLPQAVLYPRTGEELERVVTVALEEELTIIPWGGGTQMSLGEPPRKVDLVVCLRHLDRILDEDYENMTLTLEGGIRLGTIQERLRQVERGFFLPLDPPCAEEVTIGGAVAANASGPRRLLYGTLRDLVLGTEVLIPEKMEKGCKTWAGGKTVKNVSGYDMNKLYIGSLGTLAIIVGVTCRILPMPEDRATVVGGFPQPEARWGCAQALLESQLIPSCIEVYNREAWSLVPTHAKPSAKMQAWAAVGWEGIKEGVEREVGEIERLMRAEGAEEVRVLRGLNEVDYWRHLGRLGFEGRRRKTWSVGLKASVPISLVQEIGKAMDEERRKLDLPVCQLAHAGTGILYAHISLNEDLYRAKEERLTHMVNVLREQVEEMDGSLVVEYAPAVFKKRIDVWGEVGGMFPVMKRLKREFDPKGILNPGRFVGGI